MTVQDTIQEMFSDLATDLPRDTASKYLQKIYPDMSEDAVNMALNRAIYDMHCNYDSDTDTLSMYKGPEMSEERLNAMNKAFRVAVELMDSTQKVMSCSQIVRRGYPFDYLVVRGGKVFEIAYIANRQETASSIILSEKFVEVEERNTIRRIAVVDYGADISYIKRVGISKIVRVNDDNEIEILRSIPQEEAWLDMAGD